MLRFWLTCFICFATVASLSAQERFVDHYTVRLGLMPWERIQAGVSENTNALSKYQYMMAKEMAKMHGGAEVGDYHVLVVIDDAASGQRVKDAEVEAVVFSKGSTRAVATLERMDMAESAGYGGYLRFNFEEPYTLRISFSRPLVGEARQVEFSNLP